MVGMMLVMAMAWLVGCGDGGSGSSTAPDRTDASRRRTQGALAGMELYVNPDGHARQAASMLRVTGKKEQAQKIDERIGNRPSAIWLTTVPAEVYMQARAITEEATGQGKMPVLVAYNLPERDCGLYSSGGATNIDTYLQWLGSFAAGIGDREAVVILEPDAIAHSLEGCSGSKPTEERYRLLAEAVKILKRQPAVRVYLDAGNASWIEDLNALAGALRASGIDMADGFSLNVANFETTERSTQYGKELSRRLDGRHFVLDTSRNGAGPPTGSSDPRSHRNWCNPTEARLGAPPTTDTGNSVVDAHLWIKQPGDSDGPCPEGAPAAGQWWLGYAKKLLD